MAEPDAGVEENWKVVGTSPDASRGATFVSFVLHFFLEGTAEVAGSPPASRKEVSV